MSDSKVHPALTINNIRNFISITLEMENGQYTSWAELFQIHCRAYKVTHHILPSKSESSKAPKNDDPEQWACLDAIVLQWIYGTISNDLLHNIIKPGATAEQAWSSLSNIFRDNQNSRAIYLQHQFSNTRLENFPNISSYCQELKMIVDQLANVGVKIENPQLVLQTITGLTESYEVIRTMIHQTNPLPEFYEVRSRLLLEETRKRNQSSTTATSAATSLHITTLNRTNHPPPPHKTTHNQSQMNATNLNRNNNQQYRGRGRGRVRIGYRRGRGRFDYSCSQTFNSSWNAQYPSPYGNNSINQWNSQS
ncbi:uncharacterized protein [Rutidosis leptorrhynchoides]|uniref:uncharacterized protein n=1 Tax=Rutidosis leptorrhynchoides TaxID=125765 RepID=UPI003A98FCE0